MTPLEFRPRLDLAGLPFWVLAGSYGVLAAALCCSLATWAISWVAAAVLFSVLVLVIAAVFARTFRRTRILVGSETVAYINASRRSAVLNRSQLVRMIAIDRLRGSLPGGVLMLVAADGSRLGAAHWLWGQGVLDQVVAAVADDRVALERRPSAGQLELLREFGVDPAFKQRPVIYTAVLVGAVAVGVLIAWPIVTTLL